MTRPLPHVVFGSHRLMWAACKRTVPSIERCVRPCVFRLHADLKKSASSTTGSRADMLKEWKKMSSMQEVSRKLDHELAI